MIGIAGASGAGKSRFARRLLDRLLPVHEAKISILNEDCYYRQRDDLSFAERERINYDHPNALEHDLLVEHLQVLRAGESVNVPEYDYSQHNRAARYNTMRPTRLLIVEGILILHDRRIREMLDLMVYVDVPLDICLSRRLRRDIQDRGRSLDSVLNQYEATVRPMFFEFIQPSKQFADLIVPGGGDNLNALQVLYSHVQAILTD